MDNRPHTLLQVAESLRIPLPDVVRAAESVDIRSPDASTPVSDLDYRLLMYALRSYVAPATPAPAAGHAVKSAAQEPSATPETASPIIATVESVMARYDDRELEYRATFRWQGPDPLASAELALIVLGPDGQTPLAIGDGGCEPGAARGESVDISGEVCLDGLPLDTIGAPVRGALRLYPGTPRQLLDLELPGTAQPVSGSGSQSTPVSTFPLSITRWCLSHVSTSDDDRPEYQLCLLLHNKSTRPLPRVLVTAVTSHRSSVVSTDLGSAEHVCPGEIRAVRLDLKYRQPGSALRQFRVSVSVTPCDEPLLMTLPSIAPTRGLRHRLPSERPGGLSLRYSSLFDSGDSVLPRRELELSSRDDNDSRPRQELDLSGRRDDDPDEQDADNGEDPPRGLHSSGRSAATGHGSAFGSILKGFRGGRSSKPRRPFRNDEQI